MRLRQKFSDAKLTDKHDKYLMFIDLKNAYDKVNHLKLFEKLRKSNIDEALISTVEKIYSYAAVRTDNMNEKINVSNKVLQGSLISPMLLNLYINYLVIELGSKCYETLC
jgi:retron-type reverse transcriptase